MSDSESDHSVPDVLARAQIIEFDYGGILVRNREILITVA